MAKVAYGALVGSVSGSVGGVTFRRGSGGAVVSARILPTRTPSPAQERQRAIVSEARRDFETLTALDLAAFEFSVGEGYSFRPPSGARFSSARSAYVAWYCATRYMAGVTSLFKSSAIMRRYGQALDVAATGAAAPVKVFKFYTFQDYVQAPYALWMARASSTLQAPSRPAWRLVYSAGHDPALPVEPSGLPSPYNWEVDFSAYVSARVAYYEPGQVIAYRYAGPGENGASGVSGVLLMQL